MKITVLTSEDRDRFLGIVRAVKLDGKKKFVAEWKQYRKPRSVPQNGLYHIWLKAIATQTDYGYSKDYWHEWYKDKFLPKRQMFDISVSMSTTELDTKQFSEYLQKIYDDARGEHGVELYWPDEKRFLEFYDHYHRMIV